VSFGFKTCWLAAGGVAAETARRLGVDWVLSRWSETPELEDYPSEETVAEIAGTWSVNPLELDRIPSADERGLLGRTVDALS
jgi:hypothetical protein